MTATEGLLAAVDRAFEAIDHRTVGWAAPHPSRMPQDEEYSRLPNPARWRILGDRADAWSTALRQTGLARVRSDVTVRWAVVPRTDVTRTDVVVPFGAGALQMVVAHTRLGGVDHAGLTSGSETRRSSRVACRSADVTRVTAAPWTPSGASTN